MDSAPLPNQYQAPKWQASVLDDGQCFWFSNGTRVSSIWELKQALRSLDDEILNQAVGDGHNHLAQWVYDVLKDYELAEVLQQSKTRWAMIVNLERQLMRTLYLPVWVAQRWLGPAVAPFSFVDGRQVRNLYELRDALQQSSDEVIAHHLKTVPNDFAMWVTHSVGNFLLAELLMTVNSSEQLRMVVSDHIVMLEEASETC